MKRFLTVLVVVVWVFVDQMSYAAKVTKPNLIFIMVDDMGKAPVGCYTGATRDSLTPNIDRLAAGGMKFNNFYSMPQCTPTCVALLTGQYPFHNGWVNHYDVPRWNLKGFSPKVYPCVGNVMKTAGYATCIAGKWQISDFRREPKILNECGFDEFCIWTGAEDGNPPSNRRYWDAYLHTSAGSSTYQGKFGPDICADFLVQFVRDHKDEPFFIYYPMILVHGPLEESPLEREGKQPPRQQIVPGSPKGKRGKRRGKTASVYYMDHLVGRLVAALDESRVRDNTIVIWTTDNGPRKGQTVEAGVCQPFVANGPGIVPAKAETDALVDITDMLPTFAALGGAKLPTDNKLDGKSFAPLILGKSKNSDRQWIAALGGGACLREKSTAAPVPGRNATEYRDRVVRDKSYKLYIGRDRRPQKLVRIANGLEGSNIIDSNEPADRAALKKLSNIAANFPAKDSNPRYPNSTRP
ncbi:MAG: sulfatase-like hydrolase/transferase [Pirellulales bacterium]